MLNDTEKAYFESLNWEKIKAIRVKYATALQRINALPNTGRSAAPYSHAVEEFRKGLAEARVQAYIETYRKVGRYPDEGDLKEFADELLKIIDDRGNNLPRHLRGPLSPIPLQLIERIEEQLSNKIRQNAAIALYTLHHFVNEGKLEMTLQSGPAQRIDKMTTNERFDEFQEFLGRQCNVLSDLDWRRVRDFLGNIPQEIERVDFLKRLE